MSNTQMLLVAGYPDVEVAVAEFRALAERVAAKELRRLPAGMAASSTGRSNERVNILK